MKNLIATSIITSSSLLGFLTAYATTDHSKVVTPKPDSEIIAIKENEEDTEFVDQPVENTPKLEREKLVNELKKDEGNSTPQVSMLSSIKTSVGNFLSDVGSYDPNTPPVSVDEYSENEEKEYRTFLVMGTDVVYSYKNKKVQSTKGRTDAVLVVKMTDQGIDIVSIPRDSRVYIPGYGYEKINAANVIGGPKLVLKTIENQFKVHIDDYVIINTFGVAQFIDLFGGIDYNVPKKLKYTDHTAKLYVNLEAGYQHLDGRQVHDLLRFRKDGQGDFNRIKRQHEVIQAILDQILKPSSVLKIPQALGVLNNNMETNISAGKVMFLANKLLGITNISNKITMKTLPGYGKYKNGGWYWFVDQNKTNKIFQDINLLPVDKDKTVTKEEKAVKSVPLPKNELKLKPQIIEYDFDKEEEKEKIVLPSDSEENSFESVE
jgi:LCP family protein required for cell wall assembly